MANEEQTSGVAVKVEAAPKPISPTSGSAPIIELVDVEKRFPAPYSKAKSVLAVQNISLQITGGGSGQIVAFLGPSGCGKSTLLNMISGLLLPDKGEVRIAGKKVVGPSSYSATVPQAYTCFPWLTTLGNVEFGLAVQGKPKSERRRIATDYLNRVGLGDRLDAYPKQLSGGMQQRVAIARTLAMKLPILLMDEPFGALDAQTRTEMQQMLLHLWEEEQNTIVFVTHDISESLILADRLIVFSPSPARIVLDREVPFPRPRHPDLIMDPTFIHYCHLVMQTLREADSARTGGELDQSASALQQAGKAL